MGIVITPRQEQIINSTLLGDGHLWRGNAGNYQLRANCGDKDKSYIFWKYKELSSVNLFPNSPKRGINNWGKVYWYLHSRRDPYFTELHKLYYPNEEKVVPLVTLNKLEDLGLAVLYQDDGNFHYRHLPWVDPLPRVRLHTESFTKEDNYLISDWIYKRWGLRFRVVPSYGSKWRLSLGTKEGVREFMEIVRPFVVPCMSRKLGVK